MTKAYGGAGTKYEVMDDIRILAEQEEIDREIADEDPDWDEDESDDDFIEDDEPAGPDTLDDEGRPSYE